MANPGLTGNCSLDHPKVNSPGFGMKTILGIRTVLSVPDSLHSRTLLKRHLWKISLVPLHNPDFGSRFLRRMRGSPGLRWRAWAGNPFGSLELRYSTLNLRPSWLLSNWSLLLRTSAELPCPSYECHLTYGAIFGHFNRNFITVWSRWSKSHNLNYEF